VTRSDELLIEAIARLKNSATIQGRLRADGGVIPATVATKHDDLDPRLSVAVTLNSTSRNNLCQSTNGTVRVIVDGTEQFVKGNGVLELKRLQSDVVDQLTQHSDGWQADGLNTEDDIEWSDEINRYLGVVEFSVSETGMHPNYE